MTQDEKTKDTSKIPTQEQLPRIPMGEDVIIKGGVPKFENPPQPPPKTNNNK